MSINCARAEQLRLDLTERLHGQGWTPSHAAHVYVSLSCATRQLHGNAASRSFSCRQHERGRIALNEQLRRAITWWLRELGNQKHRRILDVGSNNMGAFRLPMERADSQALESLCV